MRIMFYGLQTSGATLVTLFTGQRPSSVALPDLWTMYWAPRFPAKTCEALGRSLQSLRPLDESWRSTPLRVR
jgi:hypothetical protein